MKLTPGQGYVALHPIDEDREMSYEDNGDACRTFSKIGLFIALLSFLVVTVTRYAENSSLVHSGISRLRTSPKPALVGPHHVPGWTPVYGDDLFPHHAHAEPVKNDMGGEIIRRHYVTPGPLHGSPKDTLEGRIHPPVTPTKAFQWPGYEARHHKNVIRHKVPEARHRDAPSLISEQPSDSSDSIKGTPLDAAVEAEIEESIAEEGEDVVVEGEQVEP